MILFTNGIYLGKVCAIILIESVLALEVEAAANRISNRDIIYWSKVGSIIAYTKRTNHD